VGKVETSTRGGDSGELRGEDHVGGGGGGLEGKGTGVRSKHSSSNGLLEPSKKTSLMTVRAV